ncbi:MAG: hypothetical protein CMD68_00405 [Gammaproteobacteria bacterium]|nr:hypothetical protein [Gammaproteobacteria bacterium]
MSSIYRKGRDGYYYYQTYIYNPKTKKKDKRVFHALRTKDIADAKIKQNELDLQYQEETDQKYKLPKPTYKFTASSLVLIIIVTIFITLTFTYLFVPVNKLKTSRILSSDEQKIKVDKKIEFRNTVDFEKEKNTNQKSSNFEKIADTVEINSKNNPTNSKNIIPKYTIERIERLPGAFEQGKVFVSIDQSSSYESQLQLCKYLANHYNEFSSIVICLYANSQVGINLAKGIDEFVNVSQQKQFWLAMYTNNSVEGEYFDSNPSSYLGNY